MKTKKLTVVLCLLICICFCFTACGSKPEEKTEKPVNEKEVALEGHSLHIYCGAGMTKPFQKIADAFKEETGCEMEITFANAGQIQTQINTAKEGDLFIAGSGDELKPVESAVTEKVDLVKHIPVLAVQKGNPLGIKTIADLGNSQIRVVLGDADATPIGKIANKALTDAGVMGSVNVVARSTTAPTIFNALSMDECDAVVVWKENADDTVDIIEESGMEKYIKTIPAACLSYSDDEEARTMFMKFLGTDAAKKIWADNGYEVLN